MSTYQLRTLPLSEHSVFLGDRLCLVLGDGNQRKAGGKYRDCDYPDILADPVVSLKEDTVFLGDEGVTSRGKSDPDTLDERRGNQEMIYRRESEILRRRWRWRKILKSAMGQTK